MSHIINMHLLSKFGELTTNAAKYHTKRDNPKGALVLLKVLPKFENVALQPNFEFYSIFCAIILTVNCYFEYFAQILNISHNFNQI